MFEFNYCTALSFYYMNQSVITLMVIMQQRH